MLPTRPYKKSHREGTKHWGNKGTSRQQMSQSQQEVSAGHPPIRALRTCGEAGLLFSLLIVFPVLSSHQRTVITPGQRGAARSGQERTGNGRGGARLGEGSARSLMASGARI